MVPPLTAEVEMDSPGQDGQDSAAIASALASPWRDDSDSIAVDSACAETEHGKNEPGFGDSTEVFHIRTPRKPNPKAFKKGQPKPEGSGRKKGQTCQRVVETREFCRGVVDDPTYRAGLRQRLREGTASPAIEQLVWFYAVGKPPDKLELSGPGGSPLQLDDGALRSRLALLLGPAPGVDVIDVTPRQLTAGDQEGEEDSETAVSDDQG